MNSDVLVIDAGSQLCNFGSSSSANSFHLVSADGMLILSHTWDPALLTDRDLLAGVTSASYGRSSGI